MSFPIKHLLHIDRPIEDVFHALTDIQELQKWYTTEVEGESTLNGLIAFNFGGMVFKMQVVVLEEGKSVHWKCVETDGPVLNHVMTFELDRNVDKTRVRFAHTGLEAMDDGYANMNFSSARYLESLRQLCQTGVGEAFGSPTYR